MKKLLFIIGFLLVGCYLCYCLFFKSLVIKATAYNNTVYDLEGEYSIQKDDKIYHMASFTLHSGASLSIEEEVPNVKEVTVTFKSKNSLEEEPLLRWVYGLDDYSNVSVEFDETQSALTSEEESLHFIFQDPEMMILLPNNESSDYLLDLNTKLSLAPELRSSLLRQMWFDRKFENPDRDYPFMLAYLEDDNNYNQQGVRISGLYRELTIKGSKFPLRPGDIIMAMDEPVYSGSDLYVQLYNHATNINKGVESPLNLQIIRDDETYVVQTPYYFNEAYTPHLGDTKFDATTAGFLNSMFYGKANVFVAGAKKTSAWLKNALNDRDDELPDFDTEAWLAIQKEYRLRQKYSKAFGYGSFGGLWASPLQGLSKSTAKIIAKTGISRVGSHVLASTLIETAEGAYYMYNDAPILATKKEKWEAAIGSVPESLGIGLVIGTILTK